MENGLSKRIFEAIDRHFAGGLPMTRQTLMGKNAQERIAICWQVFQMWKSNPMMDVTSCLIHTFHRSMKQAYSDKKVLEYIIDKHHDTSRQNAFHKSVRTAEILIERSLANDDRETALKALGKYNDVHRLKEDVPEEKAGLMMASLPLAVTTDVKFIDSERENISEKQLESLYKKYDASPDLMMAKFAEKKEKLKSILTRREEEEEEEP